MKVIHVEWIDSYAEIGWEPANLNEHQHVTHSVGILMNEGENYLVVANSYDPTTDEWNGRISIPNVSILETRTLCHIQMKKTTKKK